MAEGKFQVNVTVDDGDVQVFEVDVDPTVVSRISVNKNQGEIASVGSPQSNDFVNIVLHTRSGNAITGEEAQATVNVKNDEAVAEALANQAPPENPQDPADIPPTSDGVVVQDGNTETPATTETNGDGNVSLNTP